jgi:hypothetical protein
MTLTPALSSAGIVVCLLLAGAAWRLIMFDGKGNER